MEIESESSRVVESTLAALKHHFSQPIHQTTTNEETPYFDTLLGHPPEISPVVQHWLDQLQTCDDNSRASWLCGYSQHIRPVLLTERSRVSATGVPVLQQFELILSQWQQQSVLSAPTACSSSSVSHTLKLLANDISILTECDDGSSQNLCRNMVLPTLLRLLAHGIPYSHEKDVRRTCAVALLLFGRSTMDPCDVEPSLADSSLWRNVTYQNLSVDIGNWIDWTQVEMRGSAWDDPVTGIASRAAQQGWKVLADEMTHHDDPEDWKRHALDELGMTEMACAVRAHFFGRNGHVTTTTTTTLVPPRQAAARPNKYPLEFKIERAPNDSFERRPSRVHVALHFISLCNNESRQTRVLEHVLPICYALMDSTSKHIAMGAAALLHLFHHFTNNDDFFDFEEALLDVLERTCRTTREGPAVFLVCLAQSRVFKILAHRKQERRRRHVTHHLLTVLERNSAHLNDSLLLGLLVGGIIPLLQQHANEPEADALELGRLGLATLLPLLQWDDASTRPIQVAALVALIHLMMGAYPILPRHGGKIMCGLLACLGHATTRDDDDDNGGQESSIIPMATTAAAIALVLSGKRASVILDQVETQEFDPMLTQHVQAIRDEATRLQKEESEPIHQ